MTAKLRRVLLFCGVLSSLLYAATDVVGGLRYAGYSFASQAVSELMATGAPSERVVDPLFIIYDLLVITFGVGVMREAVGRGRALKVAGVLLVAYGVVGLTGPTLFEMHQRGTSDLRGDLPHIVATGVIVVLTFVAIASAAYALGGRFRMYSFGTLATMMVAGGALAPYGARLAAGEPTPGFGIIERIDLYASLLWIAVLGIVLLKHLRHEETTEAHVPRPSSAGVESIAADLSPSTRAVGFWSAVLATVFSTAYVVGQLAEWSGLLGSGGGPSSGSTPLGLIVLLTPSLFLGTSFLLLMVSVHYVASADRKIWSHAAIVLATVYTVLISTVYFVQLTLVVPRVMRGQTEGIEPFLFIPFDSFLYAVDILGYSFMSAATLVAARVFVNAGQPRVVRWFLTANGLLLPFIALQMYVHALIWIAALWAVTFPGATLALAVFFRRRVVQPVSLSPRELPRVMLPASS